MTLSAISKLTNCQEMLDDYRKVVSLNDPNHPYSIIDSALQRAVLLLNEQPGVQTTDSCASHPDTVSPKHIFYCAFLVTDEGFGFLGDLVMTFTGLISGNPHIEYLLSQVQLRHRLRLIAHDHPHVGHIWSINVPSEDSTTAAFLASCFTEAVENVINDRRARPLQGTS